MKTGIEIKAYQTPLARVRLKWMEEYRLENLVELHQQQKLQDYLSKKVEAAEQTIAHLMRAGRTREMAEEAVIGEVLAPARDYTPWWPKELRQFIPEIERSLLI